MLKAHHRLRAFRMDSGLRRNDSEWAAWPKPIETRERRDHKSALVGAVVIC